MPGHTCVDLQHRGIGKCGNGSANTTSARLRCRDQPCGIYIWGRFNVVTHCFDPLCPRWFHIHKQPIPFQNNKMMSMNYSINSSPIHRTYTHPMKKVKTRLPDSRGNWSTSGSSPYNQPCSYSSNSPTQTYAMVMSNTLPVVWLLRFQLTQNENYKHHLHPSTVCLDF